MAQDKPTAAAALAAIQYKTAAREWRGCSSECRGSTRCTRRQQPRVFAYRGRLVEREARCSSDSDYDHLCPAASQNAASGQCTDSRPSGRNALREGQRCAVSEGLAAVNRSRQRLGRARTLRGPAVKLIAPSRAASIGCCHFLSLWSAGGIFQPLDRVVSCPPALLASGLEAVCLVNGFWIRSTSDASAESGWRGSG